MNDDWVPPREQATRDIVAAVLALTFCAFMVVVALVFAGSASGAAGGCGGG
jgi:hypothetical protein